MNQRRVGIVFLEAGEDYEQRCMRRLMEDLELSPDAAELVLHLRRQVQDLQAQLRQAEVELETRHKQRQTRLSRYREWLVETTWIELEGE